MIIRTSPVTMITKDKTEHVLCYSFTKKTLLMFDKLTMSERLTVWELFLLVSFYVFRGHVTEISRILAQTSLEISGSQLNPLRTFTLI